MSHTYRVFLNFLYKKKKKIVSWKKPMRIISSSLIIVNQNYSPRNRIVNLPQESHLKPIIKFNTNVWMQHVSPRLFLSLTRHQRVSREFLYLFFFFFLMNNSRWSKLINGKITWKWNSRLVMQLKELTALIIDFKRMKFLASSRLSKNGRWLE